MDAESSVAFTDYSIWTFCFGRGRLPRDFVAGSPVASNQGTEEIPFLYSLIKSAPNAAEPRIIAIDAGFKEGRSMTGALFDHVEQPATVLAKVGVTPAQVDTLILTHLHFDHAGNVEIYPNARIYLQRREYDGWKEVLAQLPPGDASKQSWQLSSLDIALFEPLDRAVADGRVILLDGDAEIAPGVICHLAADTHTFGSQWVEVRTPDGPYVIAGDCVYSYANIERLWPPGYLQGNAWNYVHLLEQLHGLVSGRLERIVPGHDMRLFDRVPSWVLGANPVAEIHLAAQEPSRATRE